jgi:drug/metabolite transporter (DMT)-like permease
MSPLAFALVLSSGFAHAGWNFLLRTSGDKVVFSWCFTALASVLYLPLALTVALSAPVPVEGWVAILGTMALHVAYFYLLNKAYTHGDLSLTYPVARGTGLALTPIVAVAFLGERISPAAVGAILVILLGVLLAYSRGVGLSALREIALGLASKGALFAVATGMVIASYSVWDKRSLSVVAPQLLNYGIFLAQALMSTPVALRRWPAVRREVAQRKGAIVAAAILSPLAYLLVLAALTFSRVSYVAPAREIGIVVGTLLGTLVLKEPHAPNRLLGAALITAGVIALALAP